MTCRACHTPFVRVRGNQVYCGSACRRAWWNQRDRNYERYQWARLLRLKYGITPDDYRTQLDRQGGVCGVCHEPEARKTRLGEPLRLAVDHDHATGRVRALLCAGCNTGLGSFKDDPGLLREAADYLDRHKETP